MPLQQIYPNDPHTTVSYTTSLESNSASDFDLEGDFQIVVDGHAAKFDFSVFGWTGKENEHLAETKADLKAEMDAVRAFAEAVNAFAGDYLAKAEPVLKGLDNLG